MEDSYRSNLIEFSLIYLNKEFDNLDKAEFSSDKFAYYIYKQLFDIDIESTGYGQDQSTKEMTNDIGDLKIYNKNDPQKDKYLQDINKGDLVFFHTKSLDCNSPTPSNYYPGHVGIYLGNKKFIHVSLNENKIVIDTLEEKWLNILIASRDIIKQLVNNKDYVNNLI